MSFATRRANWLDWIWLHWGDADEAELTTNPNQNWHCKNSETDTRNPTHRQSICCCSSQLLITSRRTTHRSRRHKCGAPIGPNSGCGRGTETRRRGCPRCSRSPPWPPWRGGAGSRHQASHRAELPADRQTDRQTVREWRKLFFVSIPSLPRQHNHLPLTHPSMHIKNSIDSSSPVCILLSHSAPLRSPAHLPHADVSPSNHESHFPLSPFPTWGGRRRGGRIKDTKGKD